MMCQIAEEFLGLSCSGWGESGDMIDGPSKETNMDIWPIRAHPKRCLGNKYVFHIPVPFSIVWSVYALGAGLECH